MEKGVTNLLIWKFFYKHAIHSFWYLPLEEFQNRPRFQSQVFCIYLLEIQRCHSLHVWRHRAPSTIIFFSFFIRFHLARHTACLWKYRVFLSPYFSQFMGDPCNHRDDCRCYLDVDWYCIIFAAHGLEPHLMSSMTISKCSVPFGGGGADDRGICHENHSSFLFWEIFHFSSQPRLAIWWIIRSWILMLHSLRLEGASSSLWWRCHPTPAGVCVACHQEVLLNPVWEACNICFTKFINRIGNI